MSKIKHGGPAFPVECSHVDGELSGRQTGNYTSWHVGLSMRDYFAAKALPAIYDHVFAMLEKNGERVANVYDIAAIAAYEQADAMIAAREA